MCKDCYISAGLNSKAGFANEGLQSIVGLHDVCNKRRLQGSVSQYSTQGAMHRDREKEWEGRHSEGEYEHFNNHFELTESPLQSHIEFIR